jgi:hypothetical protein
VYNAPEVVRSGKGGLVRALTQGVCDALAGMPSRG